MYLFEYQAKDLMRQWGIPVLPGSVAITQVQAREVAQELGCGPWAVKAQIYAGGRAQGSFNDAPRSGGIRFSDSLDDVTCAADVPMLLFLPVAKLGTAAILILLMHCMYYNHQIYL